MILSQILLTILKKCMQISLENLYMWILGCKGLLRFPIPLCQTLSLKNIKNFHASRIIPKISSNSHKNLESNRFMCHEKLKNNIILIHRLMFCIKDSLDQKKQN